ncbi:hypothetical protein pdam_00021670 [Pocillopora damicornis]|uniref:Uncharacterized protein n=1 Tax=Pocillopora damicornis TaxID=46731 RepID=A0A3M6ULI2_POCDA|nr:hypothetical protein pdam_00021670 [Pocillopora damicornis]
MPEGRDFVPADPDLIEDDPGSLCVEGFGTEADVIVDDDDDVDKDEGDFLTSLVIFNLELTWFGFAEFQDTPERRLMP